MIHARLIALASILPMTLACQSAFAAQGGAQPSTPAAGLLPPARSAIEVAVGEQGGVPSLAVLLRQLTGSTGVNFTANASVRTALEQASCGLLASLSIPPAEAWVWVESLLENEGFSLGVLSADAPHLVAVYAQQRSSGDAWARVSMTVPSSQIEALADHPALLVSTVLELPHTDVRQLGNSLRGLTTDPTGQQTVIPVGNTNSVILSGTGRQVHQLVTMLREVDAAMARMPPPVAPEAAPAGATGEKPAR